MGLGRFVFFRNEAANGMCDRDCPVCYESLQTRIATRLPCSHTLCLSCLVRLPVPQSCPMCRFSIVHLVPLVRSTPPTVVTLNVSTRVAAPSETTQTLFERVRVAEHLANAIRVGAAPRNSRRSTDLPFDEGGAYSHRLNSLVNARDVVPSSDERDVIPLLIP